MTQISFSELNLCPDLERAVTAMGFDYATPVQSETIPLIRTGVDLIARSQTGTGKTVAFAIPAIEIIDTDEEKSTVQVLIVCPTRELAQQGAEEIRKVARFMPDIRPVEIYGGAPIDKQCIRLRRANIVIGTPGRIMDHMRRKTLKLDNLKMIVLDEADEMLNMGFKEDIETILQDTPETRQTILFSATMPPAILRLTHQFQRDPQLVEINRDQMTVEDIKQSYIEVPHHSKKDALVTLLNFHQPNRAIIFCNTKKMVDDLDELLTGRNFSVQSIHSDIKQNQRTSVMQDFKKGRTSILMATDIAARGIDVSDVDFVINFDVPPNSEYYIHRIGRTGRAGKSGWTITICSGRREVSAIRGMARDAKSDIERMELPTVAEQQEITAAKLILTMEEAINARQQPFYTELTEKLTSLGYSYENIATAALQLHFGSAAATPTVIATTNYSKRETRDFERAPKAKKATTAAKRSKPSEYETVLINVGSAHRIAVNHIIGALTERTGLSGSDIGKVDVYPDQSVVEIPAGSTYAVLEAMHGCKISGKPVKLEELAGTMMKRKNYSSLPKRKPRRAHK